MQRKAIETDAALDELEAYVGQNDDKDDAESLTSEVQLHKSTASGSGGAKLPLRELELELQESQDTIERQSEELVRSKKRINDLEKKLQLKERQIESLQNEIDLLKDDLENSRHNLEDYLIENQTPVEKIREKNKQIQNLLDELNSMESVNVDLANQVKELKEELNTAINDIKNAGDELESLRGQMNEIQEMNNMLLKDKEGLLKEIDVLRKELQEERSKEACMMDKYDEKLDNLQRKIKEQQEEMEKLEKHLKEEETVQLSGSSLAVNSEKLALVQDLQVKKEQIGYLKGQLDQAVSEIESQNEIIENLIRTNEEDEFGFIRKRKRSNIGEASTTAYGKEEALLEQQLHDLRSKIDHLENELRCKDEELHELIMIKIAYERGEYGLPEALNEIKSLKNIAKQKDERIEELIGDLNSLHQKVNTYREQVDDMKEITQFTENLSNQENINQENENTIGSNLSIIEKVKMLRLQQTIVRLEDEKIALQEELRQMKMIIRNDTTGSSLTMNDRMMTLPLDDEKKQVIQHMKQLENENKQLQLGMKEILTGLRESDSQSDVIIDCPSLERLVQLLESRSLSVDLTNVIALKAELDLLRGHNQQIRMELKRLRQQHLKLISDYSNEILNKKFNEVSDSSSSVSSSSKMDDNGYYSHSKSGKNLDIQSSVGGPENCVLCDKLEPNEMVMLCVGCNENQEQEMAEDDKRKSKDDPLEDEEKDVRKKNKSMKVEDNGKKIHGEDIKVENNNGEEREQGNQEIKNNNNGMLLVSQDMDVIPIPMPRRSLARLLDKEIQVDNDLAVYPNCQNKNVQTDGDDKHQLNKDNKNNVGCKRCSKLMDHVFDIKNHTEKVASSIRISEESYMNHIESLQMENKELKNEIKLLEEEKEKIKDDSSEKQMIELRSSMPDKISDSGKKLTKVFPYSEIVSYGGDYDFYGSQTRTRRTLAKVLETILSCLQQRIEQKDAVIKEYENLMRKSHENYQREMKHLFDSEIL